jgi:hypothetical protein
LGAQALTPYYLTLQPYSGGSPPAGSGGSLPVTPALGDLVYFNGTAWALQSTAPGGATLLSVYGVSANEVYATGTGGLVLRYNGTTWSTFASPNAATTLFGIWMSGTSNIVSIGANIDGTSGFAFGYNGSTWSPFNIGSARALTSVWGASVFDARPATSARSCHNGATWQSMNSGTTDLLWAVSGAPDASGGAFAVGYNTTIVTGSSAGAASALAVRTDAASSLEPSSAARNDRKASGAAPSGEARRSRAVLAANASSRAAVNRRAK